MDSTTTLDSDDEVNIELMNTIFSETECHKFEKKVMQKPQTRPKNVPSLKLEILFEIPYDNSSEDEEGWTTDRSSYSTQPRTTEKLNQDFIIAKKHKHTIVWVTIW